MTETTIDLEEIEDRYEKIFHRYNELDVFILDSVHLLKKDNCKLFLKYVDKIIEDYRVKTNGNTFYLLVNLNGTIKNIKLDFIIKVIRFFQTKYIDYIYKKILVYNFPKGVYTTYKFLKTFMNKDTTNYIYFIKEKNIQIINDILEHS